jgi:hypothetical protein
MEAFFVVFEVALKLARCEESNLYILRIIGWDRFPVTSTLTPVLLTLTGVAAERKNGALLVNLEGKPVTELTLK